MAQKEEKTNITTQVELSKLELQASTRPALVVMTGKQIGKKYDLEKSEAVIGRSSECEIPVPGEDISRNHARLSVGHDGRVRVVDLGSTNGTFVNGGKVTEETLLVDGDQLRCGNTIFKFLSKGSVDSIYHEELYKQATIDPLTRVSNRKHFNHELENEFRRARRYGRPLSLLMLDLDHFKKVNDTFGHQAGDYVLRHTAEVVRESLRAQDLFARYGGEEFALVLPETTLDNAVALAEKLRARVEQGRYEHDGRAIAVTLSIGVATLEPSHAEHEELVASADRQLYAAKKGGRNRVCK